MESKKSLARSPHDLLFLIRAKTADDFIEALDPLFPNINKEYRNTLSAFVDEFREPIALTFPSLKQLRRLHDWTREETRKYLLAHLVTQTKNGRQFYLAIEALAPTGEENRKRFIVEALLRHATAMGTMRVDETLLVGMHAQFTDFFEA